MVIGFNLKLKPMKYNLTKVLVDYDFPYEHFGDGRAFTSFHIDVGVWDPAIESAEELEIPLLIAFAEFPLTRILCYPITQQIAEKVHAYTLLKILSMAHTTTITSIHRGHLLNGCFPDHLTG
ncbi:MAG: nucleotidyl transferase AbiEii/AbiGii toxin family protein [Chloroflexi bacterium]|nr:nucleotidyl transferase AbiEii/AbiGii toxin family protein [Chloroflexota bacterium]